MAQTDRCLPASCHPALLNTQPHLPAPAIGRGVGCSHGTASSQREHWTGPGCVCLTQGDYPGLMSLF